MREDTGSKDECFLFLSRCTTRRLFIMIDFDFNTQQDTNFDTFVYATITNIRLQQDFRL